MSTWEHWPVNWSRAGVEAVEVLRASLREQSGAVRLRAAHLILTLGTQLRHAQELEARLVALEAGTNSAGCRRW
ncbi:MAG: hypothetical protein WKF73_03610 [Nocardioidaceae bacterium]